MRTIGEALTGFVTEINEKKMKEENDNLIRTGFIGLDNSVDVYSPKGVKKIRVRFP